MLDYVFDENSKSQSGVDLRQSDEAGFEHFDQWLYRKIAAKCLLLQPEEKQFTALGAAQQRVKSKSRKPEKRPEAQAQNCESGSFNYQRAELRGGVQRGAIRVQQRFRTRRNGGEVNELKQLRLRKRDGVIPAIRRRLWIRAWLNYEF